MTPTDRDALIERANGLADDIYVEGDDEDTVILSQSVATETARTIRALISLASPSPAQTETSISSVAQNPVGTTGDGTTPQPGEGRAGSPAQWPEDVVERVADDETAWLIEEVWSGHLHYVHRDFDALNWFRETKRVHDLHRRKEQFITKEPSLAMRFTTKADAEEWLGKQPLWMGTGQYEAREHMWPVAALATLPPPEDGRTLEQMWQEILEMDDRTSEHPDMVLLTYEEFKGYLTEYRPAPPEDERVKGLEIENRRLQARIDDYVAQEDGRKSRSALASYRGGA